MDFLSFSCRNYPNGYEFRTHVTVHNSDFAERITHPPSSVCQSAASLCALHLASEPRENGVICPPVSAVTRPRIFTGALYPDLARSSREKSDKTSNVCGSHARAGEGREERERWGRAGSGPALVVHCSSSHTR